MKLDLLYEIDAPRPWDRPHRQGKRAEWERGMGNVRGMGARGVFGGERPAVQVPAPAHPAEAVPGPPPAVLDGGDVGRVVRDRRQASARSAVVLDHAATREDG